MPPIDPAELPKKLYWYRAILSPSKYDPTGIHDGDTVNATIDLGRFIYSHTAIRIANVNAPELSTSAGKVAKAWAIDWFTKHVGLANPFYIHTHLDPSDKYGRVLAMVYAPGGECFNDDIVNAGMAVPFDVESYD